MRTDQFFALRPVFSHDEFAASCRADGSCGERTPEYLLQYHTQAGNLLRVRRGLYAVVPSGTEPASAPVDGYLLASRMADDAVLAYHTALELHGVAHSATDTLLFVTERKVRPLRFRSLRFRAVPVPAPLRAARAATVGVTVVDRSGLDVRVTTPERTLVDALDRPALGGGWEEVWRSLEAVSFYDLAQVVDYALLLGNATTVAKVGFFLEQHRDTLAVEPDHLERLRLHAPAGPHYFRRGTRASGVLLRDWNLVVPRSVVDRSWEEVR